jgi:hypothetical protein
MSDDGIRGNGELTWDTNNDAEYGIQYDQMAQCLGDGLGHSNDR